MRSLFRKSPFALLLAFAMLSSPAFAAPVNFTETFSQQSSDFPTVPGVLPGIKVGVPFVFDVGRNHIAGSFCCGADGIPSTGDDADSFQFIVPVGLEVTNVLGTSNDPDDGHLTISLSGGALLIDLLNGVGPNQVGGNLILSAGLYDFTFDNISRQGRWGVDMIVDVASGISPVPIPAAVWLFGTCLLCLIGLGKLRKAA